MKDKLKIIGTKAILKWDGLDVQVKVIDFKTSYGHDRYLVTPLKGSGQVWVQKIFPL